MCVKYAKICAGICFTREYISKRIFKQMRACMHRNWHIHHKLQISAYIHTYIHTYTCKKCTYVRTHAHTYSCIHWQSCGGTGATVVHTFFGYMNVDCPHCGGLGYRIGKACSKCAAQGVHQVLDVNIFVCTLLILFLYIIIDIVICIPRYSCICRCWANGGVCMYVCICMHACTYIHTYIK